MKTNKKLLTVLAALVIIGTLAGCKKKNDTALAEMNAKLEAMQAELDKAKSGNTAPEEIAQMETAVAEIARQEQALETTAAKTPPPNPASDFQMTGTVLTKYIGTSTSVVIPNGVTSIGNNAFDGLNVNDKKNRNITSVTIPASVTSIGNNAFSYCGSLTSITIPNSVKSIGESAFNGCENLKSITIPASVTHIGNAAFAFCNSLTSVTFQGTITEANFDNPFIHPGTGKDHLRNVYLAGGIGTYTRASGGSTWTKQSSSTTTTAQNNASTASASTSTTTTKTREDWSINNGHLTINNGVTDLGNLNVRKRTDITSVTIPNSVTSIGPYVFEECSNLASVTIPNSVTHIGDYSFSRSGLKSVTIPNSVTFIHDRAFYACESLTSVTIPNSVTYVGLQAFGLCDNLTSVTFQGTIAKANFGGGVPADGNLLEKYLENGPGTYTRERSGYEWTKR
jgi:hypothetical protein